MGSPIFRCGHPRTLENTRTTPSGTRCGICRAAMVRQQTERQRNLRIAIGDLGMPTDGTGWADMCRHGSRRLLEGYAAYFENHVRRAA